MIFWLALLVAAYGALVVLVYVMQDRLMFPGAAPGRDRPLPAVAGVQVETMELADGARFRVARGRPPGVVRGVLLYFVGNGESLFSGVQWAGELTGYDVETVVPEYPGYGQSEGRPSVATLMAAADVAAEAASARAAELGVPFLVGGGSLGTFCAVHVAARHAPARALLLAPPTSSVEVGARRYRFLPVSLLLRHRFDNLAPAPDVRCPVLVLHGDRDTVVPMACGQRVARALKARFVVATGCGHNDLPLYPGGPYGGIVRAFLLGEDDAERTR